MRKYNEKDFIVLAPFEVKETNIDKFNYAKEILELYGDLPKDYSIVDGDTYKFFHLDELVGELPKENVKGDLDPRLIRLELAAKKNFTKPDMSRVNKLIKRAEK